MLLLNAWESSFGIVWVLLIAVCTVWIFYTDIRFFWIPDIPVGIIVLANGCAVANGIVSPYWAAAGFAALGMMLLHGFYPRGLGSGDAKLTAALVIGCPGMTSYVLLLTAFSAASLVGIIYWRVFGKKMLPFAPFLLGGWWIAITVGEECLVWLGW